MATKEYQEPEEIEMNNTEVVDDFNPLDEPVIEKQYTQHNVKLNPNDFNTPIAEPSFTPPPMTGGLTQEEKIKKPSEPFNPQMKDMSKKDKNMASERVADMIFTAYKWMNKFADNSLQFDERKISKMQVNGEIDLSVEIPIGANESMSAGEFISEYNEQTKGTIVVTEEFENEAKPLLTEVLAEEGIGMTKKQELAYLFSKDIAVKGFMIYQSNSVKKDTLNMIKELCQAKMQQGTFMQQPIQQPAYTPPPQPTQPEYTPPPMREYNPDTNVNDFVNQMTGGINPNEYQYQPNTDIPVPNDVSFQTDDLADDVYEEPKPVVKVISEGNSKSGKRGRPKKK